MTDPETTSPEALPGTPAPPGLLAQLKRSLTGAGKAQSVKLNLALQGGGAHGAFTWGVLDALLEDPHIDYEGLSGSSAGAMNAVVFAHGWLQGGREGAREALTQFWSELGRQMPWGLMTRRKGESIGFSPAGKLFSSWAAQFSPSQLNPFDLNPLRDLLLEQIDFEQLRTHSPFKLFVGTTQVSTGKLRVFRESELTVDVLLASACLPKLHRTITIDGEPYWDGGYTANPAVFPLFYECEARDVLLVLLNPLHREGTPATVPEIEARIAELGFSANLLREMRMFAHARQFSAASRFGHGRLEQRLLDMRFHMIDTSQIESLGRSDSKLLPHAPFLQRLQVQGRERAARWLQTDAPALGQRSSIDMQALFG
ncbi:MAG: patatin-like phospholipase family protein [Hylemonella sp.]|nr:patatin-like phospholipase family protein [Hylemonella sp.]